MSGNFDNPILGGLMKANDDTEMRTPKKRGSKSASIESTFKGTKADIRKVIHDSVRWLNYEIVKTDEECAERLNEFFRVCHEENSFPTVEKMSLALGTTRDVIWRWETRESDKGEVRSNMIKRAKEILATIDADLVQSGKIPQITYIFRAKNFYGLVDKVEHVLTPGLQESELNVDEIKKRYLNEVADFEVVVNSDNSDE